MGMTKKASNQAGSTGFGRSSSVASNYKRTAAAPTPVSIRELPPEVESPAMRLMGAALARQADHYQIRR